MSDTGLVLLVGVLVAIVLVGVVWRLSRG